MIYGEIPKARIEKFDKPPPENAFKTVKKSFPEIIFLTELVSINGIGIYVPALNTNNNAKVIIIFKTISRLLKICFALLNN